MLENSPSNKFKFIAQYAGQDVLQHPEYKENEKALTDAYLSVFNKRDDGYFLQLTSLLEISDEDATVVGGLFLKGEQPKSELLYSGRIFATAMFDNDDLHETQLYNEHVYAVDYLRSKSYAVPFHNLSVEIQIGYGWVKLKQ